MTAHFQHEERQGEDRGNGEVALQRCVAMHVHVVMARWLIGGGMAGVLMMRMVLARMVMRAVTGMRIGRGGRIASVPKRPLHGAGGNLVADLLDRRGQRLG